MRRILLIVGLALLLLAPAGARAQTATEVEQAVTALRADPVYDGAERFGPAEVRAIEAAIREDSGGATYVATFPADAGSVDEIARGLVEGVGSGVFAIVVGDQFRAGATQGAGLDPGVAGELATEALQGSDGDAATLVDWARRVGEARENGGSPPSGAGAAILVVLAALAAAVGLFAFLRVRRRRREDAEHADELRRVADEDLVALGDDLRALDLDVEMPGVDDRAKSQYARGLQAFEQASAALRQARRPSDFGPISQTLEEGRYAMEAARAHLEGREAPEHRPPCFFDPRHGPSTRDVEWAPDFGEPRFVPACEADAVRVESGEEPHARELEIAGRGRVPYWQAPAYYGPYAGGFFGGFGGSGLLTGFLAGSLLSSAWMAPMAGADAGWGGDFGGDGGDWGGFGGGFGDLGGGGDF